jgi:methanogenic corrinoid protein MtbC1
MYTIKHAADLTGVPEATLRAWERRYGVVTPQRTDGGYRIYDDDDLDRLRQMRDLVAQGWGPAQAAERVADFAPSGGELPKVEEFVAAAAAGDPTAIGAVVQRALDAVTVEVFVQGWLMPAVVELGGAWSRGEVSVGGEHLASQVLMRHLARLFDAEGRHSTGQLVLVGLPTGARHELGIFSFATLARRRGLDVLYAGADLPAHDWVQLAGRADVSGAVIAVPTLSDVPAAQETVDALRASFPSLVVAVGGGYQGGVEKAVQLGQPINGAVDRLVDALGHDTSRS